MLFSARFRTYEIQLYLLFEHLTHVSNEQLRARALAAFPKLALWLLRDARDAARLIANLEHWAEAFRAAREAPNGIQAVAKLLSYVYWVCPELPYREFRETIRKQLPESEEAVMTMAEELIQQGRTEGRAEGRTEGRTEGRIQMLVEIILDRFGSLPPTLYDRLKSMTDDQLGHYRRRVVLAQTLDDL